MTRLLAVLGHPIAHSLSPRMHTAALEELGEDARYVALDVLPEALAESVRELRAQDALGFNVTLPHKETIASWLDALDEDARAIGAVNTVYRDGDRWVGTNTDARGLTRSLEEEGVPLVGARVVIVGAGGAARAAAFAMSRAGAAEITIAARRAVQAEGIASELREGSSAAISLSSLRSLEACDLLIQASSATLDAARGRELARSLPIASLPRDAHVIDLVYRPRRTAVLDAAEARGLHTIEGVGMLVHQGALALERWLGRPAPIAVMRDAVERALAE